MKNDRGKIAAKGENWAGFQRIPLEYIVFALSDPVADSLCLIDVVHDANIAREYTMKQEVEPLDCIWRECTRHSVNNRDIGSFQGVQALDAFDGYHKTAAVHAGV